MSAKSITRTCAKDHVYFKSSDCPTCPGYEVERKPKSGFLSLLKAPARRALENNGITTIKQLTELSQKEVFNFHGLGKASLNTLECALIETGLKFKEFDR